MTSLKNVFESDNWIITKIMQGSGVYRIDARRRFAVPDESSFFSKWGTIKYLNALSNENYGKRICEFSCFSY